MSPFDLLERIRKAPFVPFRIHLVSGKTYDIRHPEMIRIGRTSAVIFSYPPGSLEVHERLDMVGLILMERIEEHDVAAATS